MSLIFDEMPVDRVVLLDGHGDLDVCLGRGRMDILVCPSTLGRHLRIKIFLLTFFSTY